MAWDTVFAHLREMDVTRIMPEQVLDMLMESTQGVRFVLLFGPHGQVLASKTQVGLLDEDGMASLGKGGISAFVALFQTFGEPLKQWVVLQGLRTNVILYWNSHCGVLCGIDADEILGQAQFRLAAKWESLEKQVGNFFLSHSLQDELSQISTQELDRFLESSDVLCQSTDWRDGD